MSPAAAAAAAAAAVASAAAAAVAPLPIPPSSSPSSLSPSVAAAAAATILPPFAAFAPTRFAIDASSSGGGGGGGPVVPPSRRADRRCRRRRRRRAAFAAAAVVRPSPPTSLFSSSSSPVAFSPSAAAAAAAVGSTTTTTGGVDGDGGLRRRRPPPMFLSPFDRPRRRRQRRRTLLRRRMAAPSSSTTTGGDDDDEFGFGYGEDDGEDDAAAAAAGGGSDADDDDEYGGYDFQYDDGYGYGDDDDAEEDDEAFLRRELAHLESLEGVLGDLDDDGGNSGGTGDAEDVDFLGIDDATLLELLGLPDGSNGDGDGGDIGDIGDDPFDSPREGARRSGSGGPSPPLLAGTPLEKALLQGVVPEYAGVGSGTLPGDYGFDPLGFAEKDYFVAVQTFLLDVLGGGGNNDEEKNGNDDKDPGAATPRRGFVDLPSPRPPALVLRDYREAEIRHGRLAMLAAVLWPLQEILDRLLIPQSFGSTTVVGGGATLPYVPLLMTGIMLLLGYLDIFAKAIREEDAGEAFLPGECFWDPLSILRDAPSAMKRNMQERELFNGRVAMIAIAAFFVEEAATRLPLIEVPGNEVFFEPAYLIPAVQSKLDEAFGKSPSPTFTFPSVGSVDFVEAVRDIAAEAAEREMGGGGAGT